MIFTHDPIPLMLSYLEFFDPALCLMIHLVSATPTMLSYPVSLVAFALSENPRFVKSLDS